MKFFATLLITFFSLTSVVKAQAPAAAVPAAEPVKLISFDGIVNNNKILLNWMIGVNQYADKFEVERSTDGKNYVMVALVFGTDKNDTDQYMFYEKATAKKAMYRLKIFDKSKGVLYSNSVIVENNTTPAR
jgi:hypothetical protein